jgi:hypothetical protein
MKASEYQVGLLPHLKDFKWDGRCRQNNESGATLQKGFIFLPTINDAIVKRSRRFRIYVSAEQLTMQFEAFETFPYLPKSDAKTSC